MENHKNIMQGKSSLFSYNSVVEKLNKVKTEYNESEDKSYYTNGCTATQEVGPRNEEKLKLDQPLISAVYGCPFKREDYGIKCKTKSETLTDILNHFYHHHMERVDLDGRQPRFPLCCFLASCPEQFILHNDLVRHMAKHGMESNLHFLQCVLNRGPLGKKASFEIEKAEQNIRNELTTEFESKFLSLQNEFLEKQRKLLHEKNYFEEKYEKEVLQCSTIIKHSESLAENQNKRISELEKNNMNLDLEHILHQQTRDKLVNKIEELEENITLLSDEFQEKETTRINEISFFKRKSEMKEEEKSNAEKSNKVLLNDMKTKFEEQIDDIKKVFKERDFTENKCVLMKTNESVDKKPTIQNTKASNLKQSDHFFIKREIKVEDETNCLEDVFLQKKVCTKPRPAENDAPDFNIVKLHDIINHLKDENEHLQVKSKLQKQTRDKLEHKIEILEKQLGKDKNGEKKADNLRVEKRIKLESDNFYNAEKLVELQDEKEKLKKEKYLLLKNKNSSKAVDIYFSSRNKNNNKCWMKRKTSHTNDYK